MKSVMTAEQETAFNTYGCGCRCLIKLSEIHGRPISKSDFLSQFLPKYERVWGQHLGGSITSTLIDIARDLDICTRADTRTDQSKVNEIISRGCAGVMIITDRELAIDGSTHQLFHCRLFRGFTNDGRWALWEPYQDGTEKDAVCYPDKYLELCLAHFLIFYKTT
jgi:hypothetical protein